MSDAPFTEPPPLPLPPVGEAAPSLARSSSIIAIGNIASRVLGLVRETTITYFFGATGLASAFQAASTIPTMIFDLLVGGMLSAALVPVFSDYARAERRREFGQVVGTVLSVRKAAPSVLVSTQLGSARSTRTSTPAWWRAACRPICWTSPPACCASWRRRSGSWPSAA